MAYTDTRYTSNNLSSEYKKKHPEWDQKTIESMVKLDQEYYGKKYYIEDDVLIKEYIELYGCDPPEGFLDDLSWRKPVMKNKKEKPDYTVGCIWYFIGIFISLFFKEWYDGIMFFSFLFLLWITKKGDND